MCATNGLWLYCWVPYIATLQPLSLIWGFFRWADGYQAFTALWNKTGAQAWELNEMNLICRISIEYPSATLSIRKIELLECQVATFGGNIIFIFKVLIYSVLRGNLIYSKFQNQIPANNKIEWAPADSGTWGVTKENGSVIVKVVWLKVGWWP